MTNKKSKSIKKEEYIKFKNTKWVFHGIAQSKSWYNTHKDKTIYLVDVTNISKLLSSKHYIMPKKLLTIHGYHPDYMKLLTLSTNLKFKSAGTDLSFKQRLLAKQNNLCFHCGELLITSDGFYCDAIYIHHIKPRYKSASQ